MAKEVKWATTVLEPRLSFALRSKREKVTFDEQLTSCNSPAENLHFLSRAKIQRNHHPVEW